MVSNSEFSAVARLDLDDIKNKLMHPESGEGWSAQYADAVELEYRRFLYLMKKFPNEMSAPLVDVDTFWHYHILDTMKYAVDCEEVFGYFLHHFPYLGLRGDADLQAHQRAGESMRKMYEQTFGERYPRLQASAYCATAPGAAFCAAESVATAYCARLATAFCAAKPVTAAYCAAAPAAAFCAAKSPPGSRPLSVRPQLERAV